MKIIILTDFFQLGWNHQLHKNTTSTYYGEILADCDLIFEIPPTVGSQALPRIYLPRTQDATYH